MTATTAILMIDMQKMYREQHKRDVFGWPPIWGWTRSSRRATSCWPPGMMRNFEVAVPEDAVSTDGIPLHFSALNAMRVLYVEVAPWRELTAPGAPWDRAFTTPHYGRTEPTHPA